MSTTPPTFTEDFWEDRESTRKLAPVYSSRMFVEPMAGGMLKISFGQFSVDGVDYYTSVALTAENAILFGQHMVRHGHAILAPSASPAPPIFTTPAPPPPEDHGQE